MKAARIILTSNSVLAAATTFCLYREVRIARKRGYDTRSNSATFARTPVKLNTEHAFCGD